MRSEQEMLDLILDTARDDERIRAVILSGSRASPGAPQDPFQDFDVIYVVTDVAPFRRNYQWIERFGERMILQLPDDMGEAPPSEDGSFAYLVQFTDGNRLDLTLFPVAQLAEMKRESQSILLLDKDGLFEPFPPASDRDFFPVPPTAKTFADCCNEFWWLCPYVAKGLWRQEILYAKHFQDRYLRDELRKMLNWCFGFKTGFSASPGKFGKYLERHLGSELWQMLLATYAGGGYEDTWQALFAMGDLFRTLALDVAEHFGFDYPHGDDQRVSAHLRHVHTLPCDAEEIY